MSMVIKLLANGPITSATPAALYTVPSTSLGAIVNNIRIVNTHATTNVTVNVYLTPSPGSTQYRISKLNEALNAKKMIIIKPEITMGPSDKIELVVSATPTLDFVISGSEQY